MIITDSHLHIFQCARLPDFDGEYFASSCSHSKEEFSGSIALCSAANKKTHITHGFGIHPQNPDPKNAEYIEELLQKKAIAFIGETGFDFYTEDFKKTRDAQELCFEIQISLAEKYKVPIVVHCRKAIDRIFASSDRLRRLESVIFHSFPADANQAASLLRRGINAYFSFGKPLLNNKKSAIECVSKLDLNRILFETDAPFQTLKGEAFTDPADIFKVCKRAGLIKKIPQEELCERVFLNYKKAFMLKT